MVPTQVAGIQLAGSGNHPDLPAAVVSVDKAGQAADKAGERLAAGHREAQQLLAAEASSQEEVDFPASSPIFFPSFPLLSLTEYSVTIRQAENRSA